MSRKESEKHAPVVLDMPFLGGGQTRSEAGNPQCGLAQIEIDTVRSLQALQRRGRVDVRPPLLDGAAAGEIDLIRLVRGLTDLDRLPVLVDGEVSRQFSSYDRASRLGPSGEKINWGANGDAGHYLRKEPSGEAVMAQMEGPGVITQTWSANPQGSRWEL